MRKRDARKLAHGLVVWHMDPLSRPAPGAQWGQAVARLDLPARELDLVQECLDELLRSHRHKQGDALVLPRGNP
jgi:hypothetical protein